jgi:hypothetical protein
VTATAIYSKNPDHERTWRIDQIPWSENKPEAFAGYDQMIYFGRMLANFGPNLRDNLERNPGKGLHTGFVFTRMVNNAPFSNEQYAPTQRYENQFVHILEFSGFQFKPLPPIQR